MHLGLQSFRVLVGDPDLFATAVTFGCICYFGLVLVVFKPSRLLGCQTPKLMCVCLVLFSYSWSIAGPVSRDG